MAHAYFTKAGDTLQDLIKSLGVSADELYKLNPWLTDYAAKPEDFGVPGGAPVFTEKQAQRSPAVEGLINADIESALNFIVGKGVPQAEAASLRSLLPELSQAWEGINAKLIADTEQMGITPLKAPSLTPLDFLTRLRETGTLDAMLRNPQFTGQYAPAPALTSRRIRF